MITMTTIPLEGAVGNVAEAFERFGLVRIAGHFNHILSSTTRPTSLINCEFSPFRRLRAFCGP
jgi:hypothetical protein